MMIQILDLSNQTPNTFSNYWGCSEEVTGIRDLSAQELNATYGGISLTAGETLGTGIALVGLGIAIVSGPVGMFGLLAATTASYWGGGLIGRALIMKK